MEQDGDLSEYQKHKRNRLKIVNAVTPERKVTAATGYRTKHTVINQFIAQPLGVRKGMRRPRHLGETDTDEDGVKYFGVNATLVDERTDFTDSSGNRY